MQVCTPNGAPNHQHTVVKAVQIAPSSTANISYAMYFHMGFAEYCLWKACCMLAMFADVSAAQGMTT